MTPKEVQEHGFPRSRKGYDMAEVDAFLDKLTEDYTALYTNYGKLSTSYAKLRKKAQALAAALEQVQQQNKGKRPEPAAPVAVQVQPSPAAVMAGQEAVDELLRAARKDAQAIRAGAERERQEIINQATDYAAENVERLKAEVAAEEQHLASLKKATSQYISQVRQLISRQVALLDNSPVQEEPFTPELPPVEEPKTEPAPQEEPTVRVEDSESALAEEISRNMNNITSLQYQGEEVPEIIPAIPSLDDELSDALSALDESGSLFEAIANGTVNLEFDEE